MADPLNDVSALLRTRYRCTARESALTEALLSGASLSDAAASLDITVHTARTHLKRVFRKTGTNRQSQLLRLLLPVYFKGEMR